MNSALHSDELHLIALLELLRHVLDNLVHYVHHLSSKRCKRYNHLKENPQKDQKDKSNNLILKWLYQVHLHSSIRSTMEHQQRSSVVIPVQ